MTSEQAEEIAANLERAEQSCLAAKELSEKGFYDFAASRAYSDFQMNATLGLDHRLGQGALKRRMDRIDRIFQD